MTQCVYSIKKPEQKKLSQLKELLNGDFTHGLSEKQVKERLKEHGPNAIVKEFNGVVFIKLLSQIFNPLNLILIAALILSLIFFSVIDAGLILIALLINIIVGFWQERKADKIFATLSSKLETKTTVIRDGLKKVVSAKELVPGDVIVLQAGQMTPADARLFEVSELVVDESSLTGESRHITKSTEVILDNTPVYKHFNMVFAGSLIKEGTGKAMVVSTGMDTEFGKIAKDSQNIHITLSPTQTRMRKLALYLGATLFVLSAVVASTAFLKGYSLYESALIMVALAVSAVPEGLPAAIMVALAVGMERILKRDGLVKNSASAETLGSVDYILTDKTGTITSGNMELKGTASLAEAYKDADPILSAQNTARQILEAATLASDAFFEVNDKGVKTAMGRPIEKAIIKTSAEYGLSQDAMFNSGYARKRLVSFSSHRRYAISLNDHPVYGSVVLLSGAPEALMRISAFVQEENGTREFTDDKKKVFLRYQERLSSQGYKTTAVAQVVSSKISQSLIDGKRGDEKIVFLGLLVFADEVRVDVKDAIKYAQDMGVGVLMVTGDHSATALAVAKEVGLADSNDQVVSGVDFESMSDEEVYRRLQNIKIFARMLPAQKKRLIQILQNHNLKVAMTGDGVNDAPALALADIGVVVESGTDIAKEAGDLILLKNSFSVISFAVQEGRRLTLNIYRTIIFMVSTSFGELALLSGAVFAGAPLPLLPQHLLWHNMVEGGLMNFPFAFEKNVKNTKSLKDFKRVPRKSAKFTVLYGFLSSALLLALYAILLKLNFEEKEFRTIMFLSLSLSGFVMAMSLKNFYYPIWKINIFDNKFLNISIIANLSLLYIAFIFDPIKDMLQLVRPNYTDFWIIAIFLLLTLVVLEMVKYVLFIRTKMRVVNIKA